MTASPRSDAYQPTSTVVRYIVQPATQPSSYNISFDTAFFAARAAEKKWKETLQTYDFRRRRQYTTTFVPVTGRLGKGYGLIALLPLPPPLPGLPGGGM